MKITQLLQRVQGAFKRHFVRGQEVLGAEFVLDAVAQRVAQLQPPAAVEPERLHTLIKLVPIPLPRTVRWEGHCTYTLAWVGSAVLAWGAWQVPLDWLFVYGVVAVMGFAGLFRLEGPQMQRERAYRLEQVEICRQRYAAAEQRLQAVLHQRFAERMHDFHALRHLYEAASQAIAAVEGASASALYAPAQIQGSWEQHLAAEVDALERQMLAVVHELEAFSSLYKEEIDSAITERHDARLAYWQARLDATLFTGEAMHVA